MQNLTRIEIENFQSIEFVSIPLDNTGVHWINGKPNVGKSAVLKAIQALYMNVNNFRYKEMIRDGQDTFRVKGYFGEDDWVELSRGEDDRYTWVLDGRAGQVERTQGKVPFEVSQYYQLYWTGDKIKRHLNFTLVGDPLFFVETTQGENTIILEKALGTDRLTRVSRYASTERREVRSELKTIRTFHEESETKLERLTKEVEEGEERLYILDRLENTIESEMGVYDKVDELLTNTNQLIRVAQVVQQVENTLKNIDTEALEEHINTHSKVEQLYHKEVRLTQLERERDELTVNVSKEDVVHLETDIQEYNLINRLHDKLGRKEVLEQEIQELEVKVSEGQVNELESEIQEYERVLRLMNQISEKQERLSTLKEELGVAEKESQELAQKQEDFLSQFEVCPFCERPMDEHGGC